MGKKEWKKKERKGEGEEKSEKMNIEHSKAKRVTEQAMKESIFELISFPEPRVDPNSGVSQSLYLCSLSWWDA